MQLKREGRPVGDHAPGRRVERDGVLDAALRQRILPREAALALAAERVRAAMATRRFGIM